MGPVFEPSQGAIYHGNGVVRFRVWAPRAREVAVHLLAPQDQVIAMQARPNGYFEAYAKNVKPGSLYQFRLDQQKERPDPCSRFQPQGVHGPSQLVEQRFSWDDQHWFGIPLASYVIYELHVGTFTAEGTFEAAIPFLDELKALGITAIEIMPMAQFPGERNWGYDGVYLYAPQNSYGGPHGLKKLINACHARGLAVILDVVYNHLGPEGNYLGDYGYYFTDRYHTPWGDAVNFDGAHSDEVRRFFIENALYWQTEFHVDALRLDAIHAIRDFSACPFLAELSRATTEQAERLNRRFYLIAESNLNDVRVLWSTNLGGLGMHAQWMDDFHHALHTTLTGERGGYYEDFDGFRDLAQSYAEGFVYSGQYSKYRSRCHGNSSRLVPAHQFVVSAQNHDQIGNRMMGDRLSQCVSFDSLKLSAAAVALAPFVPMLFMGEEYGETAPFLFFTSHADPALIEGVRQGRRQEFAAFQWQGEVPDPQAEATFFRCKLQHDLRTREPHQTLWEFYRELFRLRRTVPALSLSSKKHQKVHAFERDQVLCLHRWAEADEAFLLFYFGEAQSTPTVPLPAGRWQVVLDSSEEHWRGAGSKLRQDVDSSGSVTLSLGAKTFVLFRRQQ